MAGLDAAMATGAFGQDVTVLLRGTAVFALAKGQCAPVTERHVGKTLAALPLYDVESIYAEDTYWSHVNPIDDLEVTVISAAGIGELIADTDHVLSF